MKTEQRIAGKQMNGTGTADELYLNQRGYRVKSPLFRNLLTFLMVFGPGLIVMEADNDAGAVSTLQRQGPNTV